MFKHLKQIAIQQRVFELPLLGAMDEFSRLTAELRTFTFFDRPETSKRQSVEAYNLELEVRPNTAQLRSRRREAVCEDRPAFVRLLNTTGLQVLDGND